MKKRYRIHPGEYAVGENEKLYSEMAAKGWRLEKRGARLSRFVRSEPEKLRYRIEFSSPVLFEDQEMDDEQIALYEECGWHFVTHQGLVHVFCAPEGSDAPEFYSDPRQQAATLKALRRSYRLGWIVAIFFWALALLMGASLSDGSVPPLAGLGMKLQLEWFRQTAVICLYACLLLFGLYESFYGAIRTALLYRHLKKGLPLDHAPKKRRIVHRAICGVLLAGCVLSTVMIGVQLAGYRKTDLPEVSDGPYLTLADLGFDGKRVTFMGSESRVETCRSLAARWWMTREYLRDGHDDPQMYQNVYTVRTPKQAEKLAVLLMYNAVFADDPADYQSLDVPGLDQAFRSRREFIAVKDCTVWYINLLPDGANPDTLTVLGQLAGERAVK